MAEYIKREDAKRTLFKRLLTECFSKRLVDIFLDDIAKIPAENVRENVRGKWLNFYGEEMHLNKKGETTGESYCSECKMFLMASDEYECYGNFCPNCGADMRNEQRK